MKMWSRMSLLLFVFIATSALEVQFTEANALFRFSVGFRANSGESTENDDDAVFNKTIIFVNHHIIIRNNLDPNDLIEEDVITERPSDSDEPPMTTTVVPFTSLRDFWLQQQNLHGSADLKLKEIFAAITNLHQELSYIERRSEFLEFKLQEITLYRNFLAESAAEEFKSAKTNSIDNLEHYLKYILFVDVLLNPTVGVNNIERTMDYILLKLAVEKYEIIKLKEDVAKHLTAAKKAWEQYSQTKVVEIDV